MRFLLGAFKFFLQLFIILATIAGLAYAYDSYGRGQKKYVIINDDDCIKF